MVTDDELLVAGLFPKDRRNSTPSSIPRTSILTSAKGVRVLVTEDTTSEALIRSVTSIHDTKNLTIRTAAARKSHEVAQPLDEGHEGEIISASFEQAMGELLFDEEAANKGELLSDREAEHFIAEGPSNCEAHMNISDPELSYARAYAIHREDDDALVHVKVAMDKVEKPKDFKLTIVPLLDQEDPSYSSVCIHTNTDTAVPLTGMVFPVGDGESELLIVMYNNLDEFLRLRSLAFRQTVLSREMVTVMGKISYGEETLPYGAVQFSQALFAETSATPEMIRLLPVVLRVTPNEHSLQCCINMTLLLFPDATMHLVTAVLSTVPAGIDIMRHPSLSSCSIVIVQALADYQSWHAHCPHGPNDEQDESSSPLSPPIQEKGSLMISSLSSQKQPSTDVSDTGDTKGLGLGLQPVSGSAMCSVRKDENICPFQPRAHQNVGKNVTSTPGSPRVSVSPYDPRLTSVRGVYSPLANLPDVSSLPGAGSSQQSHRTRTT